jgi:hypothetical protein
MEDEDTMSFFAVTVRGRALAPTAGPRHPA